MEEIKILLEGENCWRQTASRRVAFLVDGEAYFSAFAAAVERARHSVYILGWDIDSRVRLYRDGRKRKLPAELGRFLNAVAARNKELHIRILDWDFAFLYALEREPLPILKLGWQTHKRIHFRLDDQHPIGASQHQKVVVIDDQVAFVGGFDLAQCRWDTPEHRPADPRRRDNKTLYAPFHDVQMLVDGATAAALGELARRRWQRVTGEVLAVSPLDGDPWPADVSPDMRDVQVAIVRTEPAFNGASGIREVETLYRDAIAAARSTIYIENQYLTSSIIGDSLAARLREKDGPEVLLVLPRECSGWLEENTMGVLRARLLRQLREADRYGRLRIGYPNVEGLDGGFLQIHSKVLIVDDRLLRIGSANLSNRSMGFDTECDLAIEGERAEIRAGILAFRHRLLAEHLGCEPGAVEAATVTEGSLLRAVDALSSMGSRTLLPLNGREENWLEQVIPEWTIVDPERPSDIEQMVDTFVARDRDHSVSRRMDRRWLALVGILTAAIVLTVAWRWTPLREWLNFSTLLGWAKAIRDSAWALPGVVAAFVAGGLLMVPVTLLVLVTALILPPLDGFVFALAGCLASALTTYGIGHLLGSETIRRLAGTRLSRLSRQLGKRGLLAVVVVRFLPIAPYSIVNMVAGASHIRLRDFFLGTLLGMAPGIAAISLFRQGLLRVVRHAADGKLSPARGYAARLDWQHMGTAPLAEAQDGR